ncbi:hypothetical protein PFISCL1PPCAC_23427, partial [Pristionchus fissidentatus]
IAHTPMKRKAVRPSAADGLSACKADDTADIQNPAVTAKGKRKKRPRKNFYARKVLPVPSVSPPITPIQPAKEGTRTFREDYVCLYLPCSGEYVLEPAWVITPKTNSISTQVVMISVQTLPFFTQIHQDAGGSFETDSVCYLQYGDGHFYSAVVLGNSRSEKYLNDQVYVHYAKRLLLESGLGYTPDEKVSRKRKKKSREVEEEDEEEEKVDEIVEECVVVGDFDFIILENESSVLADALNSPNDSGIDISEEHCYARICT